jgi:hypothetical protein
MSLPYVVDVDDLCDQYDPMDTLKRIKEAVPDFKVTIFAIPTRCSDSLLKRYMDEDEWIRIGMHGWVHSRGECLSWNPQEAHDKIMRAIGWGYEEAFRAPHWIITPQVYMACAELNMPVADHWKYRYVAEGKPPAYTFNMPEPHFRPFHFHTWDTMANGLEQCEDELVAFLKQAPGEYKYVSEVAC